MSTNENTSDRVADDGKFRVLDDFGLATVITSRPTPPALPSEVREAVDCSIGLVAADGSKSSIAAEHLKAFLATVLVPLLREVDELRYNCDNYRLLAKAAERDRDRYFATLAGALFAGHFDKLTVAELREPGEKLIAERDALRAEVERLTKESDTRWNEVDAGYITMVQVLRGLCKSIRVSWERCAPQDVEAKLEEMEGYLEGKHPYSDWIKRDVKDLADLRAELAAARQAVAAAQEDSEANADKNELCRLLASAWYHGRWRAETFNEKRMEKIMVRLGFWPTTQKKLLVLRTAIAAARRQGGAE